VRKRFQCLLLILTLLAVSLSGCSLPNKELDLSFPVPEEAKSLDPQIARLFSERIFARNAFEGLVTVDSDGKIIPGAAESCTVSDDGLTYTFKIRESARWYLTNTAKQALADRLPENFDTRVTAHDFVFAFRRAVTPETACPKAELFLSIKNAAQILNGEKAAEELGVEAVSDTELRITLIHPERDFLRVLTDPVFSPCSEVFFNACGGRYGLSLKYIICNGPFILFRWNPGGSMRLTRNTVYSGERTVVPDVVRLFVNPDTASVLEKVTDGDYSAGIITAADARNIKKPKNLKLTEKTDILWAFVFNSAKAPFSVKEMRKAFVLSTNLDSFPVPEDMKGKALSPVPVSIAEAEGLKNPALLSFNEEEARALFKKAQADAEKDGAVLSGFSVLCIKEHEEMLKFQLQEWQKIFGVNFSVSLIPLERAELVKRVQSGNYEAALYPLQPDTADISSYLRSFAVESEDGIYCFNKAFINGVERLLSDGFEGDFKSNAEKLAQILTDEAVVLPVFSQSRFLAVHKAVSGIYFYPSIDDVYFIKATDKK